MTLLALASRARADGLSRLCGYCQMTIGVGETYHFWARTGGIVVPVTFLWDRGRYELGVFRMTTRQELEYGRQAPDRLVARPNWGFSVTRRLQIGPPAVRFFIGLGFSYKTETDELNSTHWNFAEQLGVRLRLARGGKGLELCLRHWSNAGLRLPNHGQDFFTLTYVF